MLIFWSHETGKNSFTCPVSSARDSLTRFVKTFEGQQTQCYRVPLPSAQSVTCPPGRGGDSPGTHPVGVAVGGKFSRCTESRTVLRSIRSLRAARSALPLSLPHTTITLRLHLSLSETPTSADEKLWRKLGYIIGYSYSGPQTSALGIYLEESQNII